MSLTNEEVRKLRKIYGSNEILPSKFESNLSTLIHIFNDPMGLMLLTLGFIYLFIGKKTDAIVLFISFIPVTAVDVALELKAKKALNVLKSTLVPMAKVIRNNKIIEIEIKEIVPGDTIVFEEGQSLAADGKIIECDHLLINEATLTGESVPVEKIKNDPYFTGTTILQGTGLGLVEKTGKNTQFGKIAKLLDESESEISPLKKKVNAIIKIVIIFAIFISVALFSFIYFKEHNFLKSLIESLTFGMAAIPEEFPLVFTLYLSMGAYRLSKIGVLVKSLPSVETLGSVDIICTDKTGTLTEGKFQLEKIEPLGSIINNEKVWQIALMACEKNPVDAMEIAIYDKAENYFTTLMNFKIIYDYPFLIEGKYMSHVWQNQNTNETIMAMKGSVEGVINHCLLNEMQKKMLEEKVAFWANQGKRILGLAYKKSDFFGNRDLDEKNLIFAGLIIFSDPVRNTAKIAVKECQESGISIKMITGDHPLTAHAVADELNIIHSHDFLYSGSELSSMNKKERWLAFQSGAIFSRVSPEQKHEMVQALKSFGSIVAMTGDGINDAPALKAADIGISMGENATDVARSSAQMVLMKNDFSGIVNAIFEGRKIFSNLKRSFSYLISFHVPIIFFALIPPLLGMENILLPINIVLLELIVHPVSAFSFENLPAQPKINKKTLMNMETFIESFISGLLLSIGSLFLYKISIIQNDLFLSRTLVITTIMFGNIFFVLVESWPTINHRFILTTILLFFFIMLIVYFPPLSSLFYLTSISTKLLLRCFFVAGFASIPTILLKILAKKLKKY